MHDFTTEVLIVGAGPVGLTLAICLAEQGVRPMIIDRELTHQSTSRAAVIHAHSMDILARINIAESLVAAGLHIQKATLRDRNRLIGTLQFDWLPSDHNYLLMLPQDRTEAIMIDRLAELGIDIQRGTSFASLHEAADHVIAELQTSTGNSMISARYIVGADGMHSAVREACGIAFDGDEYAGSFVLADVTLAGAPTADAISLFLSPAGLMLVAPLPHERFRIVAAVDDAPDDFDAAAVQSLLDARGPTAPGLGQVVDVDWSSHFRLHHRLARHYRKGHSFIVGDAAHVHSPAGGQGMNMGIVDAYTLGKLLGSVITHHADPATLHRYETLRRPVAEKVLRLTDRMMTAATIRPPMLRMMRNLTLSAALRLPTVRKKIEMNLSGLPYAAATLPE